MIAGYLFKFNTVLTPCWRLSLSTTPPFRPVLRACALCHDNPWTLVPMASSNYYRYSLSVSPVLCDVHRPATACLVYHGPARLVCVCLRSLTWCVKYVYKKFVQLVTGSVSCRSLLELTVANGSWFHGRILRLSFWTSFSLTRETVGRNSSYLFYILYY